MIVLMSKKFDDFQRLIDKLELDTDRTFVFQSRCHENPLSAIRSDVHFFAPASSFVAWRVFDFFQ